MDAYTPTIIPPAEGVEPGSQPHWKANLRGLDSFEFSERADELLRGLKGRSWSEAKRRVYEKHRAAFHASLGQVES